MRREHKVRLAEMHWARRLRERLGEVEILNEKQAEFAALVEELTGVEQLADAVVLSSEEAETLIARWSSLGDEDRLLLALYLYDNPSLCEKHGDRLVQLIDGCDSTADLTGLLLTISRGGATLDSASSVQKVLGMARSESGAFPWDLLLHVAGEPELLSDDLAGAIRGRPNDDGVNRLYYSWAQAKIAGGPSAAQEAVSRLQDLYHGETEIGKRGVLNALGNMCTPEAVDTLIRFYGSEGDTGRRRKILNWVLNAYMFATSEKGRDAVGDDVKGWRHFLLEAGNRDPDEGIRGMIEKDFGRLLR